jgi:hypothetical protein
MDSVINKTCQQDFLGLLLDDCFITVISELGEYILQDTKIDANNLFGEGDYIVKDNGPLQFFVCELVKGSFFKFTIDIEESFDINKIKPLIQEYPEDIFTIVGIEYDGKNLEKENVADFNGSGQVDFYVSNA